MRIGPLNKRVRIQSRTTVTRDDYGQPVIQTASIATVWASIEPLSGRELVSAQQQHAETTHRVRMRFQPGTDISPRNRLRFDSRDFEIISVINHKEKKRMLELLCKEIA